jgi:signal transduction histidine kinase
MPAPVPRVACIAARIPGLPNRGTLYPQAAVNKAIAKGRTLDQNRALHRPERRRVRVTDKAAGQITVSLTPGEEHLFIDFRCWNKIGYRNVAMGGFMESIFPAGRAPVKGSRVIWRSLLGAVAIALLTWICFRLGANDATTTCLFLIVVVMVSLQGSFLASIFVSLIAVGCIDYFFTSPIFSFRISNSTDIFGLATFLITSAVVTELVSRVRRLMQAKLMESEAYLSEAQGLSHTGSFGWKVSSGELVWSDESYRIFNYEPAVKPSMERVLERTHPEDAEIVKETIERASHDGSDFDFEHRLTMPDGSVKYVHVVAHAQKGLSGKLEYVGAMMDITERKRAEDALRETQTDLEHVSRVTTMGQLTASLAHEVNQPIAAAITNANTCMRWLAAAQPNVDEARAAAARIVKDGTRAAEIISRIRSLFKKGPVERKPVDVNDVIREMVVMLRGEASRSNIFIRVELAMDLPDVLGDRVQLQQVLMNLMLNGIEAMKDVSGLRELVVESQSLENGEVLVAVNDTGAGLPAQQTDRIFNAFFTTKAQGTGMGLAISRSIVESHGGRIWAVNNEKRGASFRFSLSTRPEADA